MGNFATVKTNMLDFQCYRADGDGHRPAANAGRSYILKIRLKVNFPLDFHPITLYSRHIIGELGVVGSLSEMKFCLTTFL